MLLAAAAAMAKEGKDEIAGPLRECHEKQLGHLSGTEIDTLITLLNRSRAPHEDDASEWK